MCACSPCVARRSLRAIDPERYSIVDESSGGAVLEEIEGSKAFYEVYDGAVYMHQGRTYLCKKLDLGARVAVVRPADLKYYTKPVDFTDVHVVGGRSAFPHNPGLAGLGGRPGPGATAEQQQEQEQEAAAAQAQEQGDSAGAVTAGHPRTSACAGPALVTTRWLGFVRVWRGSGQVFDRVDLFLPDVQYETHAAYLRLPPSARRRVEAAGLPFRDGVHAAAHAVLNVLGLFVMHSPSEVGTECDNPYDTRYKPERLLLYDKHPGGIGLAAAVSVMAASFVRQLTWVCCRCAPALLPDRLQPACCTATLRVAHV